MKKEKVTNEVVAVQETALVVQNETEVTETFLSSDMILPRVLLQQALSEAVSERKAQAGDIIKSTTGEILGNDRSEKIRFLPLTYKLTWVLQESVNGKFEFRGTEPRTVANENLEWDFMKNGTAWKRVKGVDVYALLSKDIDEDMKNTSLDGDELPDVNKVLLPVVIGFRSTSYQAGKDVINHFMKVKTLQRKLPTIAPFMYELELGAESEKNDKGTFFVFTVGASAKKAKPEYISAAREWVETIKSTSIRVDEEVATTESVVSDEEVNF